MKLYEIQHINETHNPRKVMGEELRFTHSIGSTSGEKHKAEKQPKDWDHVRRLSHMLFLAWNDKNPVEGTVYLGEFFNPESEDEEFYKFFKYFNGFPISDKQKSLYKTCKNNLYTTIGDRRVGATTLLLTIAGYEASKGHKVFYFGHNMDTAKLYEREFQRKNLGSDERIIFTTPNTDMDMFRGCSSARAIFDNFWMYDDYYRFVNQRKYKRVTECIRDFKEYSIDTY